MKHNTLTLGSLFSGSGAFELAGLLAGIQPIWSSEVAPFPIRVTTKRMPFVKHYGEIYQLPENAPAYTVLAPDCFFTQSESFRK